MTHADATFDTGPRFTLPRWNPSLNILAPLAGIVLLAAIVAAPSFNRSEAQQPSEGSRGAVAGTTATDDSPNSYELYRAAAADFQLQ